MTTLAFADLSSGELWTAVLERRTEMADAFVYGVKSTGIYCRCTCSARRPAGVEAVEFFASAEAAEEAGYRACLRCRPAQGAEWRQDYELVKVACEAIEAADGSGISLDELAARVGRSAGHLQKVFRRVLGISPRQYGEAVRLRRFKALLREEVPVGQAAWQAGLRTGGAVYEGARRQMNCSPGEYVAGLPGARISYAVVECPLGMLLLAASERGVCAVKLGDHAEELAAELRREFARADVREEPEVLGPFVVAVLSVVTGGAELEGLVRLPLDICATAFQKAVWEALRLIPRGEVRTYGEIAAELGKPGGARGVGGACAANQVALVIPCHRVVRQGADSVSGYRWGPARKRHLLEMERED